MSRWETDIENLSIEDKQAAQSSVLADVADIHAPKFTADDIANAGWGKPVRFDYAQLSASGGSGPSGTGHKGSGDPTNSGLSTQEAGLWAHNAARYEWKEEYGDVAPRVPELEQRLFHDQFQLRKGNQIEALTLKVTQESAAQIQPINSVCEKLHDTGIHC